jgi:hypothetical protein
MLHSHHKSRLAPLYIRDPRGLECAPRRGETLHLSEKLFPLNHHLRAVAVVFDFVNPVLARWWLIDRGSKLRLNEP